MYLFYCSVLICYILLDVACGIPFSWGDVIKSLTFGKTLVQNGWFFQTIILVYFAFWIMLSRIKSSREITFWVALFCAAYWVLCNILQLNAVWYQGIWSVLAGVVIANNSVYFKKVSVRENTKFFLMILIVFLVCLGLSLKSPILYVEARAIGIVQFTVIVLAICNAIPEKIYNNKIMRYLGGYSLEIYAVHGLFISLVSGRLDVFFSHKIGAMLFVLSATMLTSIVFKKVYRQIRKFVNSF